MFKFLATCTCGIMTEPVTSILVLDDGLCGGCVGGGRGAEHRGK